jgi:excisionase family DNA binding protein
MTSGRHLPAATAEPPAELTFTVTLTTEQLERIAQRVALLISDQRDDGFLDVAGAARYLSTTPKAIYHLVERRQLPHHRAGGRLLFDPARLRGWVESGGEW